MVGGHDREVLAFNKSAYDELRCVRALEIVPGATHLFEERGALKPSDRFGAEFSRISQHERSSVTKWTRPGWRSQLTLGVLLIAAALTTPQELFANNAIRVPILLYHRFATRASNEMTVTPATFEAQIKPLLRSNCHVLPLRELLSALQSANKSLRGCNVVITADDGHETVYSVMFPILRRYKLPATLFIYPSAISNASYALTWPQLEEMKASGLIDVQSHTYWHPNFRDEKKRLSPDSYVKFVRDQFDWSRSAIETRLGGHVDLIAWPFGLYDKELMALAASDGFIAGFSLERRVATRSEEIMALPRFIVTDRDVGARFEHLINFP
jgi:peptidoglycan/xylan/chitin deacetylase (PgdA/CDA1 family)